MRKVITYCHCRKSGICSNHGTCGQSEFLIRLVYPQYNLERDSSLTVKGIVTSIEQDYVSPGMVYTNYHVFRYLTRLNITEVVWTSEGYLNSSVGKDTVLESDTISADYDFLSNPHVTVGQEVVCASFYLGVTDLCYSLILAASSDITKSFLKPYVILQ